MLDVNCGLGVLSMFAAKAGAKHVYAIDTSSITQLTKRIVKNNKYQNVITVIKGAIDTITLPVQQVDVIITFFRGQESKTSIARPHSPNRIIKHNIGFVFGMCIVCVRVYSTEPFVRFKSRCLLLRRPVTNGCDPMAASFCPTHFTCL